MANKHILLVEDESHIAKGILFNLARENYTVVHVENARDALEQLRQQHFDLVILDRMLPDSSDGLDVCAHIRALDQQLPILMLTAMGREQDKVDGLSSGADDYLTKPFNLSELLLRVSGMLRRAEWYRTKPTAAVFELDQWRINLANGETTNSSITFVLTELELRILRLFIEHQGEVLSRAFLLKAVWGMAPNTETRTLDNFIVRLRKYFELDPAHPRHFITVRGKGYRFKP
ncbi:MAG: response regulator transcription factor [Desulfuromonadaceae bacterium]|nr:response regulator transcription factor [Desulfuromonadaceae bacterium]